MTKVVINAQHGGFSLSHEGVLRYAEIKGLTLYPEEDDLVGSWTFWSYWLVPEAHRPEEPGDNWHRWTQEQRIASNKAHDEAQLSPRDIARDDPALVQLIEEMGDNANGRVASLRVVEIPDDADWQIDEYDGLEWVAEKHRTWS